MSNDSESTRLYHDCSGDNCTFCEWRKEHEIKLRYEHLLKDEPEEVDLVHGVRLTTSQIANPSRELATQQIADFLAHFDDDCQFPPYDEHFEEVLTQLIEESSENTTTTTTCTTLKDPSSALDDGHVDEYTSNLTQTVKTTTSSSISAKSSSSAKRFASPKGKKTIELIKRSSIPVKTCQQTS